MIENSGARYRLNGDLCLRRLELLYCSERSAVRLRATSEIAVSPNLNLGAAVMVESVIGFILKQEAEC